VTTTSSRLFSHVAAVDRHPGIRHRTWSPTVRGASSSEHQKLATTGGHRESVSSFVSSSASGRGPLTPERCNSDRWGMDLSVSGSYRRLLGLKLAGDKR
jgi:hypothetical protein